MKIVVGLGHPAHFHFFKNIIKKLVDDGHEVKIVITDKDILRRLLDNDGYDYDVLSYIEKKETLLNKLLKLFNSTKKLLAITKEFRPDFMIGSLTQFAYVSRLKGIPFSFCGEDDITYTYLQYLITCPFVSTICTPLVTKVGIFKRKRIGYNGYQKLTYLHPNCFKPNPNFNVNFDVSEPYFIIRLVSLSAYHDVNVGGLNKDVLIQMIDKFSKKGRVFITSEKPLSEEFEKYKLPIDISDIHHALFYASAYVGDSQSMAVEAAMLGIPSLRFNDFAGKISVLEELEHKYGLTFGIKSSEQERLYAKIDELLAMPNLREEFQNRRRKMLADKIDVTAFFTWFIENYPESKRIMKENPEYQYRFR